MVGTAKIFTMQVSTKHSKYAFLNDMSCELGQIFIRGTIMFDILLPLIVTRRHFEKYVKKTDNEANTSTSKSLLGEEICPVAMQGIPQNTIP